MQSCCRLLAGTMSGPTTATTLVASRASVALTPMPSRAAAPFGRTGPPTRQIRTTTPVCMGRKAAKVAKTKNKEDAKRTKIYGKYGKLIVAAVKEGGGRGLHSFTSQLYLSALYWIGGARRGCVSPC